MNVTCGCDTVQDRKRIHRLRRWPHLEAAAVITDEAYVEIELLRKHGMSLRKIAAEAGCAVNTVRSHLEADAHPR